MPAPATSPAEDKKPQGGEKTKAHDGEPARPDDGELGGVALGMQVWDDYERDLKAWEAAEAAVQQTDAGGVEGNAEAAAPIASTS